MVSSTRSMLVWLGELYWFYVGLCGLVGSCGGLAVCFSCLWLLYFVFCDWFFRRCFL